MNNEQKNSTDVAICSFYQNRINLFSKCYSMIAIWITYPRVLHGARELLVPRMRSMLRAQNADVCWPQAALPLACGYENYVPSGLRNGIAVSRSSSPARRHCGLDPQSPRCLPSLRRMRSRSSWRLRVKPAMTAVGVEIAGQARNDGAVERAWVSNDDERAMQLSKWSLQVPKGRNFHNRRQAKCSLRIVTSLLIAHGAQISFVVGLTPVRHAECLE
jgi:hypothetical protein